MSGRDSWEVLAGSRDWAYDSQALRRHFVAVATASYDDPEYPDLPGVVEEVAGLRAWLCDTTRLGGRAFVTAPRFRPLAEDPPRTVVEETLRDPGLPWTSADAAVVFVTGHGERADGTHWLVLGGTDRRRLRSTGVRTSDLIGWLMDTGIRHLLLIVDACFAAATMADVARFDADLPAGWLVLPSAMKDQLAMTGALSAAIAKAVEKLASGQGEKYGLAAPYFTVEQFLSTVDEFLGEGQRVTPLHGSQITGPHPCLPNPHLASPAVAPTQSGRHELALPRRELDVHWAPRARGVASDTQSGWLFTGRAALMRRLIAITAADAEVGTTVVSGAAGSGKSAVLARLVTLADPDFLAAYAGQVALIPADLRPRPEAVDVAVVATGKWPNDVLAQILAALSVPRPEADTWNTSGLDEGVAAWTAWLMVRREPVTIVVDAVDEAHDPLAVTALLARLTGGANTGKVRLLAGVRSPGGSDDPTGSLSAGGGRPLADDVEAMLNARRLRIDQPPWWDAADIRAYATSILRNTPGSPYTPAHHDTAAQVADALAERAGHAFLVARIAASSLAARPQPASAADPAWLAAVDAGVLGVFRDDLHRTFADPHDRERAVVLLRAVAFAYGRGLPWGDIWPLAANAVADTRAAYGDRDIAWLLASPMAAYLVTDSEGDTTVYRLFHDTVRATLRERWSDLLDRTAAGQDAEDAVQEIRAVQARIVARLTGLCPPDCPQPPAYIRRHLVEHAAAGHVLDGRVLTSAFLPYTDPMHLLPLLPPGPGSVDYPVAPGLLEAYRHSIHQWDYQQPSANGAALTVWSAARGTPLPQAPATRWRICWAHWPTSTGEILSHSTGGSGVAAAVLRNGQPIAVVCDRTTQLWDLSTREPLGDPFTGYDVHAMAVAALPGGRLLAITGSFHGTVRVWDLETREPLGDPLTGDTGTVNAVTALVLPQGRLIVVAGSDEGVVRAWDLDIRTPEAGPVTVSWAMPARAWDLGAYEPPSAPPFTKRRVGALTAITLPDGRLAVVVGLSDGTAKVLDLTTGQQITGPLLGHRYPVVAVTAMMLPDGRPIAITGSYGSATTGTTGRAVRVWDLRSGQRIGHLLTDHPYSVTAVAATVLANGQPIAVIGSHDGTVRVWDLYTGQQIRAPLTGHTGEVNAVTVEVLTGGRPIVITGSMDGTVRVWDLDTNQQVDRPLAGHTGMVGTIAIAAPPDGRPAVISGSHEDQTTRVWDLATGQPLGSTHLDGLLTAETLWPGEHLWENETVWTLAIAVLPGGRPAAVTGSNDFTVRVWDLRTCRQICAPLTGHTDTLNMVAVISPPDGPPIAVTASHDTTLRVWDLDTGQQIMAPLTGHTDPVHAVAAAVLSSGRPIAVSSSMGDRTMRVWDIYTGQQVGYVLMDYSRNKLMAVTVLPDGHLIAFTASDTVKMWDLNTCQQIGSPLTGHTDYVNAVATAVLPDGRRIAVTGSDDRTVRVWDLDAGEQIGHPLPVIDPVTALAVVALSADTISVAIGGQGVALASLDLRPSLFI